MKLVFKIAIPVVIVLAVIGGVFAYNQNKKPTPVPVKVVTQTKVEDAPVKKVLNISGSGSKKTEVFTVGTPWSMGYSYDCTDSATQGVFQAAVYESDGTISTDNQPINVMGKGGEDIATFYAGGTYYLTINTTCKWKITVLN